MKIRNGFVSNSSSSSFVVAFPHKPQSAGAVKDILWPHSENVKSPWSFENDKTYSAIELANYVFDAINNQIMTVDEALDGNIEYSDCHNSVDKQMIEYLDKDAFNINNNDKDWYKKVQGIYDEIEKHRDNIRKDLLNDLHIKAAQRFGENGYELFTFEFSDNDGAIFAMLEHGTTFANLPHIRVNRH